MPATVPRRAVAAELLRAWAPAWPWFTASAVLLGVFLVMLGAGPTVDRCALPVGLVGAGMFFGAHLRAMGYRPATAEEYACLRELTLLHYGPRPLEGDRLLVARSGWLARVARRDRPWQVCPAAWARAVYLWPVEPYPARARISVRPRCRILVDGQDLPGRELVFIHDFDQAVAVAADLPARDDAGDSP